MERKQAFERLRPACVDLLAKIARLPQNPSARREIVDALERLLQTLQQVSSDPTCLDPKLAEFVFIPISQVLRSSRIVLVRALELSLACISILLQTGWRGGLSPELTGQLLILFTFLANPSSAESGLPATSEDLQTAAFKCMGDLVDSVSSRPDGKQQLTATSNIPALGKAVLVMVDSLADVPSNSVKFEAAMAIKQLSTHIADIDALASFLPRIVSSLTKVLTPRSSNRANFRVLEQGLNTLSIVLTRTLNDQDASVLPSEDPRGETKDDKKVVRTKSWLQATSAQIKVALASVLKLRYHDKNEVRHALLQLCLGLMRECRNTLTDCIGMLVETLVTLTGHGSESDTVETDLKILISSDISLASLLRESLHGWVISLPRLMQSKDDSVRRQIIHQISVTLRLLNGEELDLSMIDDLLAANLRDSISEVFQDSKCIGTVVEAAPGTGTALAIGSKGSTSFQPLTLRLRGQDVMMGEFSLLLQELAKSKSALVVLQDLVSATESGTEETRLSTFWLSTRLLQMVFQENAVIDDFLDFGSSDTQTELLDQLYSMSLDKLSTSSLEKEPHWHYQALALEVVALQASRYKTEFRVELIEALYPILHAMGSSNSGLQHHAITCLNIIAEACDYSSASDLVVSNVDYIINAVGLKLNYHDISPQAPQVLLMTMRLCGPSLLPFLDDLVGSIFSALERYHGYPKLVELLFSVLKGIAEEGVKAPQLMLESGEKNAKAASRAVSRAPNPVSEVAAALKKLQETSAKTDSEHTRLVKSFPERPWEEDAGSAKADTAGDPQKVPGEEGSQTEQSSALQAPAEPPPPEPRTFALLLKISELTQHYLTSSSPSLRTSLLSLLHTTIPALAKHEDSFLPLINTLWPVLMPRLDDPEAYVVANALEIMSVMCTHTGGFMKSRIESVWPTLTSLHKHTMKATAPASRTPKFSANKLGASASPALVLPYHTQTPPSSALTASGLDTYAPERYTDTPTRMIRTTLINLLSSIAQHVAVHEKYFDDLVDMLDPVLENRADVREALEKRNADAVWLRLWRKGSVQLVKAPVVKSCWNFAVV